VDLDVVFLGTAGSVPTARRNPSATLVRRGGERLLFDCGEGTQRQLLRSDVGLVDLEEIFFTHYHADHFLGLPGLLKTFALRGRDLPLMLYGPRGLDALLATLHRVIGRLGYEVGVVEVEPDTALARNGYELRAFPVRHGRDAIGWTLAEHARPGRFDVEAADALGVPAGHERGALQAGESVTLADGRVVEPAHVLGEARPGRTVVLTGDTAPSDHVVAAAYGADLLVHEATFCEDEAERALETEHSTAREAARVALDANVRLLALTHVSSRYGGGDVEREAREVFPDTVVPRDFDLIEVPFAERGAPELVKRGARQPRPVPSES
jgi:ribonuclease Z